MRPLPVVCCLLTLLLASPAGASGVPSGPDQAPTPSGEQLAESVTTYEVSDSVTTYVVEGTVTSVESERRDGAETVLSLDTDILFEFGSAQLPPPAAARITALVADLPRDTAVAVTGHTDSIGDPASNLRLSQERAQAVADVVAAARPDLRLTVTGRGEQDPVAANTTGGKDDPEGRQQNRRVELRYAA